MKSVIVVLMACGAIGVGQLALARPACAQPDTAAQFAATTLTLSAEGEVHPAPDEAWLQTGVTTEAPSAAAAVAQTRAKMNAVVSALAAKGVQGGDVQTSALQLSAQYADEDKGARRLTGYQAQNAVTVRVRDLPSVGAVVDALVEAGANQIDGVSFDLADRHPAEDQARRLAAKALEAKAALYAQAAGYRIKRLVSLSEGGGPVFQPMARMAPMAAAMHAPTPVAAGELSVRISVSGVYELTR